MLREVLSACLKRQNRNPDCTDARCLGWLVFRDDSVLLHPFNVNKKHWVTVCILNIASERPRVVILDSLHSTATPPASHAFILEKISKFLEGSLSELYSCPSCARRFNVSGADAEGNYEGISLIVQRKGVEVLAPLVPQQQDHSQCGPMSVLALWHFLRHQDFRRYCLGEQGSDGIALDFMCTRLHPYSHTDALELRKFLSKHKILRCGPVSSGQATK